MPAATLKAVYAKIADESPELVVHAIMELEEQVCAQRATSQPYPHHPTTHTHIHAHTYTHHTHTWTS
jgi:hypothetical protein